MDLDALPVEGNRLGRGFRDVEFERRVLEIAQRTGIGAQFGGKYFCHDARVIRLPRHGASCPVAIADAFTVVMVGNSEWLFTKSTPSLFRRNMLGMFSFVTLP